MVITTRQTSIIFWAIFLSCLYAVRLSATDSINVFFNTFLIQNAENKRFENPDSAIHLLNLCYAEFEARKDTLNAIDALTSLATVYGNQANYKGSYDQLWKALLLADQANLLQQKSYVYRKIGRYYGFYKRREKTLTFLNLALSLNKSLVEKGQMDSATLTHSYADFCASYLEFGEPALAQTYLDSSFLYFEDVKSGKKLAFLNIQQAFIFIEIKKYKEAIQIIEENIPWFEKNHPSYLVLIYSYLGDAYRAEGMQTISERCYQKSLNISDSYHSHVDFSILVREKLSNLYFNQQRYLKALEQLKRVLQLERLFFDSRSANNRPLLEIQDEFRVAIESKKQLLKEQRLAQLEHESEVSFLQKTIISVLFVSLLFFGMLYFNHVRSKYRTEKQLIQKKQELENQKNKELLAMKNRELATIALKLIEKDEFLQELKNKVTIKNGSTSLQDVKHLIKTATTNSAENWTEFEARFVAVNKEFYKNLRERFPKLTQGDLKLSALIKLRFTSKEIARLMGISVESVHTTRYRLRKKLKVAKGVDLTDFITKF